MRLLLITQKVNKHDPVLGFFHDWIAELSKHTESIVVVCLEKGKYDLPGNVKVVSLGKEKGFSKVRIVWNFFKAILSHKYDKVFVHMNPIYVVLAGWWWRLSGKRVALWYTHKSVDLKLRIADIFVNKIFSASGKSFRLKTKKLKVMGHGIDSKVFYPGNSKENNHIITVGRISSTKNYEPLIQAVEKIKEQRSDFKLSIAGGPVTESDKNYFERIKNLVKEKDLSNHVDFLGPVNYQEIPDFYRQGNIFVNLSNTGSLDKAILEAMATGLWVVTSNEAMKPLIDGKYITDNNPDNLASKILSFFDKDIDTDAVEYVKNQHGLENLIERLALEIKPKKKICLFGIYDRNYSRNSVLIEGFKRNGYEVIHCNVDPKKHKGLQKYFALIKEYKKIRNQEFEKVIVAFPGHSVVWLAKILFKRSIIFDMFLSLYNSEVEDRKNIKRFSAQALYLWFQDYVSILFSNVTLVDTHNHKKFISKKFHIRPKKIKVVYVGSNDAIVFPKQKNKTFDKFIVHFHGSNIPLQGVSVIERAAQMLEANPDIEFHMYGFVKPNTSNMVYHPRFAYKEMSHVLSGSDLVLGIFGGTEKSKNVIPNKVFEGLAVKKPVLTAETPAIKELLQDGVNVVLSKNNNPENLAETIEGLYTKTEFLQTLADNGYNLFLKQLTPDKIVTKLINDIKHV